VHCRALELVAASRFERAVGRRRFKALLSQLSLVWSGKAAIDTAAEILV
jgi:hypothetical protein